MTVAMQVDPANAAQLEAWDGDEGAYWAVHADRFDRALAGYQESFMAAARITADSAVLDLGCGCGGTTLAAARRATRGSALGVDLSSAMLATARRRADELGVHNAGFEQADAQVHPFAPGTFDVAIGRTSAMFFADKALALANVARAIRPGGSLALLCWRSVEHNEWMREIAGALSAGRQLPTPPPEGPQPFSMSDPDRVRAWLTGAGFGDVGLEAVSAPMWFGTDAEDALTFILGQLGWLLEGLDEDTRRRAVSDLEERLAARQGSDGVTFGSACWLVSARLP
jgi:SAM-dependent methyltransferase